MGAGRAKSKQMHALGLKAKQAQGIAEWNNTQIAQAQAAQAEQIDRKVQWGRSDQD